MKTSLHRLARRFLTAMALVMMLSGWAQAAVYVQCPGDTDLDRDAVPDVIDPSRQVRCMHFTAGDGFSVMSDGRSQYIFGFHDVTGIPASQVVADGVLHQEWPGPTIVADEGDEFYLTLTNVGMAIRPDLFDAHTVHWHGFPQSSSIFDGLPESSFGINMFSSLTYYYNVVHPGTFLYHCHVEATEHMQMGMNGNLYVRPAQNRYPDGWVFTGGHVHSNPDNLDGLTPPILDNPLDGDKYAYNDGDASTRYDVELPLMMGGFDAAFHDADEQTQPLPFAEMRDNYAMLNGRGYPDTVNPLPIANANGYDAQKVPGAPTEGGALRPLVQGEILLIRLINLNVTHFWSLTCGGLPMKVIARDSDLLHGPDVANKLYYMTNSVTLGGGENADILIDTTGIPPGTYPIYIADSNLMSTPSEDFGGMMSEIVVVAP